MKKCCLWLTTEEIRPEKLKGSMVVVIDVLLATTTLVTIMERGARRVFPVTSVEDANQLKTKLNHSSVLTGGELGGKPIKGFDCDHWPDKYTTELVKDKDIIFLSSNGTRAIMKAKAAGKLLLGNLRNAYAISEYINQESPDEVIIVCAGSLGQFSLEDYVCANIILSQLDIKDFHLNDAATYALEQRFNPNNVEQVVAKGRVGRNLQKAGLIDLFKFVIEVDSSQAVVGLHNEIELDLISLGVKTK